MGLLDIKKTSTDKLTDIKIWLEKNVKYPDHISESEKRSYTDTFFDIFKKKNKYYVNVKNGGLTFKEDCEEVPYKLFEFYWVNGGVTIPNLKRYKGFPQIVHSITIGNYNMHYSDKEKVFGPSVVMGVMHIRTGAHNYESFLNINESLNRRNNLPLHIHLYCADEFEYELTKEKFKDRMYIGKIVRMS